MRKFIKKNYFILFFLQLSFLIGCYSYSRGGLIAYKELPNSQTLKSNTYQYKIVSRPSFFYPLLGVSFSIKPTYEYKAEATYEEIRTPLEGANTFPTILKYGGAAAALVGLVMFVDTAASESAKETRLILLGSGAAAWLIGALTSVDTVSKKTGNEIKGEIVPKSKDGISTSIKNKNIEIKIDNKSKSYITDSQGEIKVDLIKDFGLVEFKEEENLEVIIEFLKNEQEIAYGQSQLWSEKINLKSSEWTKKYFIISADETNIFDRPSSSGDAIGTGRKSELYEVLDLNATGWTKILFKEKPGWINSIAGSYIWRSSDKFEIK